MKRAIEPILLNQLNGQSLKKQDPFLTYAEFDETSDLLKNPEMLFTDNSYAARHVSKETTIPDSGRIYLRIHPERNVLPFESEIDAMTAAKSAKLQPFANATGWDHGRNEFGAIVCPIPKNGKLRNLTLVGLNKEIVGLDAYILNPDICEKISQTPTTGFIPTTYFEDNIARCLASFLSFYKQELIIPPFFLHLRIQGVKGYSISVTSNDRSGKIVRDTVEWSGEITSLDQPVGEILKPFLEMIWKAAGLKRPAESHRKSLERLS